MRYWLFVLLTLALAALIGWSTYQSARLLRRWKPDYNLLLSPAENLARVGLLLVGVGLGLLSGLPARALGWGWPPKAADLAAGAAVGVGLSLALTAASDRAIRRWGSAIYSPTVILNVLPTNPRQWALVLAALGPAVAVEELLFRSLLIGGLSPLAPTWLLAVGVSVYFGLLHLPQGRLGVVGTAVAGLALSALFIATGSLAAALTAHYAANVLQLVQAGRRREDLLALEEGGAGGT
ncbi:MAG: CPBP family intramembrane metalloprotease [Caldilineales bacterium]|nr:CPBP family intramembrane metalloprotease [Caldilineales bacterium]MDW8318395.1 CPBP family intramembrane glutamic endopeptidase [Anaerolineae bacterium]